MDRRAFIRAAGAAAATLWMKRSAAGARTAAHAADSARAIDDRPLHARVTLSNADEGRVPCYTSIAAALQAAPSDGARPFRIGIDTGVWREKLIVDKPNVQLLGADRQRSIIRFDAAAGMPDPHGQPWGTWGCASVIVRARDFRAENLTIENAFDYVGNLGSPRFEPIGSNGLQAVALMLDVGADRSLLLGVDLVGHQDTLFVDAGHSLFRDCRISGSVDFVFGAGQALFQRCELVSRYRPDKTRQGYVAVPSTLAAQPHGLLFERCRLLREPQVPDASVVLGRAWRPTREFPDGRYGDPAVLGSAVFMHCWMDAHIAADGWEPMAYSESDGTRVLLEPNDARLFEFGSEGPGALRSATRRWLDAETARQHSASALLGDWSVDAA